MSRVIHFEITAEDPERAVRFYSRVFGWNIEKWEETTDYWLVSTGKDSPGIDGAIMPRSELTGTVNTIEVPSLDSFLGKILENGGKVITDPMPIPNVGYFAYCRDTEGNAFGVMQPDQNAK